MKKFYLILFFIFLLSLIVISGCGNNQISNGEKVTVYKSSNCGCCGLYVKDLGKKGFDVETINTEDLLSIKNKYGVSSGLQSCHTTIVGDYFVEGHVPFEAIKKLLNEKPDIKGIALPGMPSGSPGMPGPKLESFTIYSIGKDGSREVFMTI